MRPLIFFCPFFPDWEATNEAIEEQVARESYFQWLRDNERRQVNSLIFAKYLAFCYQNCSGLKLNYFEKQQKLVLTFPYLR